MYQFFVLFMTKISCMTHYVLPNHVAKPFHSYYKNHSSTPEKLVQIEEDHLTELKKHKPTSTSRVPLQVLPLPKTIHTADGGVRCSTLYSHRNATSSSVSDIPWAGAVVWCRSGFISPGSAVRESAKRVVDDDDASVRRTHAVCCCSSGVNGSVVVIVVGGEFKGAE